ncbi:SLC12A7 [Symbiodinium sp. CCMP2592]|nr:SLC12A7 [Symbiodinium sp. CCMP2592]
MEGDLADAVTEAIEPVQHLEKEWEPAKLCKRLRDYFKKAAKSLEFKERSWMVLVNDFADSAFSSIFQAIGDRHWLDRVDFVFVLDAGIKEFFPRHVLEDVPQTDLERLVLAAHDRAFEEQRYLPKLWDFLDSMGLSGKTRKKAYDSIDEGRKVALKYMRDPSAPDEVKAFVSRWVDSTVKHLHRFTQGEPASVLDESQAAHVFERLLKEGCMPIPLLAEHGLPPEDWAFVPFAVRTSFAAYAQPRRPREAPRGEVLAPPQALPDTRSKAYSDPPEPGLKADPSAGELRSPEPAAPASQGLQGPPGPAWTGPLELMEVKEELEGKGPATSRKAPMPAPPAPGGVGPGEDRQSPTPAKVIPAKYGAPLPAPPAAPPEPGFRKAASPVPQPRPLAPGALPLSLQSTGPASSPAAAASVVAPKATSFAKQRAIPGHRPELRPRLPVKPGMMEPKLESAERESAWQPSFGVAELLPGSLSVKTQSDELWESDQNSQRSDVVKRTCADTDTIDSGRPPPSQETGRQPMVIRPRLW